MYTSVLKKNYLANIKVLILKGLPKQNLEPDKIGHSWKGDFHSNSFRNRANFSIPLCYKMLPWEIQRARLKPQAGQGARAQRRLHTPPRPTPRPFAGSREQVETAPGFSRCNYLPALRPGGCPEPSSSASGALTGWTSAVIPHPSPASPEPRGRGWARRSQPYGRPRSCSP